MADIPSPNDLSAAVAAARDALNSRAGQPYLDQFIDFTDAVTEAVQGALAGTDAAVAWTVADGPVVSLVTLSAAASLTRASLRLDTGLDDPAATLALGTRDTPDLIFAPGTFPVSGGALVLDLPDLPLGAGTEIVLTLTGAPSSGSGRVRLEFDME
jgi:hypothetical protein